MIPDELALRIERITPRALFALTFAALLLGRSAMLVDPPYWDALMGAFPQGLWLARHGFDCAGLLTGQHAFLDGGPNVYPFSIYPLLIGALYALGLAPRAVFAVLHVVSFACAAGATAFVYRFAQRALPASWALGAALVFALAPLTQSLSVQMNMDMPLCLCTLASALALAEGRWRRASCWSLAALLIKPTAVIGIVANLVWLVLRRRTAREPGLQSAIWIHAALLVLFALEVLLLAHYARAPAFIDPLGGWRSLLGKRIWVIPEYGVSLIAFVVLLPNYFRRWRRGELTQLEPQCALFLFAFLGFYLQYTNTLPRYFLQSYPFLILLAFLFLARHVPRGRWSSGLLWATIGLFAFNEEGRLYPQLAFDGPLPPGQTALRTDGHLLERSLEYRDDLELDRLLAQRLVARGLDQRVVIANWPLLHVFGFPEFGYVERALSTSSPDLALDYDAGRVNYRELYEKRADGEHKLPDARPTVWVLTPNNFTSPDTCFHPGRDTLVETVESGRLRAWIVERSGG